MTHPCCSWHKKLAFESSWYQLIGYTSSQYFFHMLHTLRGAARGKDVIQKAHYWTGVNILEYLVNGLFVLPGNGLLWITEGGENHAPTRHRAYIYKEALREFAIDLDVLNKTDGVWTARYTTSWTWHPDRRPRSAFTSQDPYCWLLRTSPETTAAFEREDKRCVMVRSSWDENFFYTAGAESHDFPKHRNRLVESDWIMNCSKAESTPQPGGYHCREAFIQTLVTGDPELLIGGYTDLNINVGNEQLLRSVLATYTHLPRERFRPVLDTGLETNLAIRQLSKADESFFYVANPCQWHVSGTVTLATDGEVTELASGRPVALTAKGDARDLRVNLTPFGLAAYRVSSGRLKITAYRTDPMAGEELARLTKVIKRIAVLLKDPVAKLSLSAADRKGVWALLRRAYAAANAGENARAWSLLTHPRVWGSWQDCLEKAAAGPFAEDGGSPQPRITYDREHNAIRVVGFAEDSPATLDDIRDADRRNRWRKVRHDRARDTYRLDAALWIGDERSNGTFLQVGDRKHPNVTVVVKGSVWVRPPRESPERSDGRPSVTNCLTLGNPDDDGIRATLKFDCESRGEHGLFIGFCPAERGARQIEGGSLRVYNSTITALRPDREHAWGVRPGRPDPASPYGATRCHASELELVNAAISWFCGSLINGMQTAELNAFAEEFHALRPGRFTRVEGATFEHGDTAVRNMLHYLRGCVFRDLDVAVAEGGGLGAKLVNCRFEDNRANYTLGSVFSHGIAMVDCQVASAREPVVIRRNKAAAQELAKRHMPLYPACRERRSLAVKAVDRAGRPVRGAFVDVNCATDPAQVTRGLAVTDEKGLTPSDPETDAILVTTKITRATDDPKKPEIKTFDYDVTVRARGFKPRRVCLPAGKPIPRPLAVRLEQQ